MSSYESTSASDPLNLVEQQPTIPLKVALREQQEMAELNIVLPEHYQIIKKSPEKVAKEIPPPPCWLGRSIYWFRLGFAVVVLISSLLSLSACGVNAKEIQWQPASKYFERNLIEQIVTENSSLAPSEDIISKIQIRQLVKQPRLTLVNFNNTELCGQLGCLYVIYLEVQGKTSKVFSRYLHPELPKDIPLFELSDRSQNDLPCIVLNQLANGDLMKLTLCYNGSKYQNSDSKTVKLE